MKSLFALVLILSCLMFSACTSRTEYGECVGLADDKDPHLKYEVSTRNAVIGIVCIETVIVPVLVLKDQIYCPVGKK